MKITSKFDSGNIYVVDAADPADETATSESTIQ